MGMGTMEETMGTMEEDHGHYRRGPWALQKRTMGTIEQEYGPEAYVEGTYKNGKV